MRIISRLDCTNRMTSQGEDGDELDVMLHSALEEEDEVEVWMVPILCFCFNQTVFLYTFTQTTSFMLLPPSIVVVVTVVIATLRLTCFFHSCSFPPSVHRNK